MRKIKEIEEGADRLDKFRRVYKGRPIEEIRDNVYLIFRAANSDEHPRSMYVGKTRKDIYSRLSQHYNEVLKKVDGTKPWDIKHRWFYDLVKEDKLEIILLNKVQRSEVYIVEQKWIKYLKSCDFRLMNFDNRSKYKEKIIKL